jgi:Fe-S oxidoreductase
LANAAESQRLRKYESEMNTCIRCAYCFEGCPVLKELGWDTDSARGKVILAYGLMSGEIEPSEFVADKIFQCTFCKDCVERCSSSVRVPEILEAARAELVDAGYASDTHRHVISNVKATGNIYGDEEVMAPEADGDTPVFLGCQYLSRPNKTKKYLKILTQLGIKPQVQDEICCGFPMQALGFAEDFEEHKEEFLKAYPQKELIAFCPTCTMFLKEEYGLDVKHAMQAILERLPEADLGMKVTWHDPCDLSRGLGIIEEPRAILRKLGCEVVEMKHHGKESQCCGGGGGILMSDESLSDKIALARIREAVETGADTLVTSCPTCETVLKKAAATINEKEGTNIVVRNIEDIIWKGLKG